jgi:hypothetical protein
MSNSWSPAGVPLFSVGGANARPSVAPMVVLSVSPSGSKLSVINSISSRSENASVLDVLVQK